MSDQEEFNKKLLDHVGPKTKSFCAGVMVLGMTLLALGFNISGPMNRVANAWAESYEIQNDMLVESSKMQAIELALAQDQAALLLERLEELEVLAHESTQ